MSEAGVDEKYDYKSVESKWGKAYSDFDGYKAVDLDKTRKKKYVLVEFPYPSGSGLHIGHAFSMTGADVYARYMRMKGFNVLFPMGWDAFGLPTENYALRTGISPQKATADNTKKFKIQMDQLGMSFDWTREINTTDPSFYKWTQWIFIKLFEQRLATKEEMPINWCPKDKIGLANEEVIDGKCERCGTEVERRTISQWVVKITKYADRLIEGLKQTDFISKVKAAQINWIDRREGIEIKFEIKLENSRTQELKVFTTRPDTLAGVTFIVVSPEHPIVKEIKNSRNQELKKYIEEAAKKSDLEREERVKDKTGVDTGLKAINPVTKKEIPIWVADYVSMNFGTGAVMGVPSHNEKDKEFAVKFGLETNNEYTPDGKMQDRLIEEGIGELKTTYHLRDWIFSRQHYWGEPVPMIWCENCGWQTVPEDQLPIRLPEVEKYQPTETGESPLANIKDFVETTCPKCGGPARRETDTMPNWAGSDWYFLRYLDPKNDDQLAEDEKMKYWLPVDVYLGGDEHNTLHMLYSRFIYQFLWDLDKVPKDKPEPYQKRISHGVILGPDGSRMSKTRGNVIVPDEIADKYGADATRMYLMFMGPFDATMAWNERSLVGVRRFIERIFDLVNQSLDNGENSDEVSFGIINKLVKKIDDDLALLKYNTAIAAAMGALNELTEPNRKVGTIELKKLILALAVFIPFAAEELWQKSGGEFSVHSQKWPEVAQVIEKEVDVVVQVDGKMRGVLRTQELKNARTQEKMEEMARADPKVGKYLEGKKYKVIFVPGRIINFVLTGD